ncbi:MAG: M1 family metallopeptidase [Candidatus Bathyanammoxibius sp.]
MTALLLLVLVPLSTCPQAEGGYELLGHDISLELDLDSHDLRATDVLSIGPVEGDGGQGKRTVENAVKGTVVFSLNSRLRIDSVKAGHKELEWRRLDHVKHANREGGGLVEIQLPPSLNGREVSLRLSYHGELYEPLDSTEIPAATITPEFVYLSPMGHWYADLPGGSLATFKVATTVPSGYEVVMHGRLTEKKEEGKKTLFVWEADYPSDSCFLLAARYVVTHDVYNSIDIYTYFFPEEQELSESYIGATKRYLKMYEEMLGPYPFSKFAIVENLFPTGYGMPSYTLLGRDALKLPFIVHISLGHEVAHNWWGNSVFVHPDHGNWCEGLATYVADYHYKELINAGSAMEYRRNILRTYSNHITEETDFSLEGFTEGGVPRTDKAVRSVLYGKCAMVFHMLKTLVGPETFTKALKNVYKDRQWKQTSWTDFREIFEQTSGRDLDWFFEQWVFEKGAPRLELRGAAVEGPEKGGGYKVNFELSQDAPVYRLLVPVVLVTEDGKRHGHKLVMNSQRQSYSLSSESRPRALYVDPEFEVFRHLLPGETPPTLDKVLGEEGMLIVYPTEGDSSLIKEYKAMSPGLKQHAPVKSDVEVATNKRYLTHALFALGGPDNNLVVKGLLQFLPPSLKFEKDSFVFKGTKYDKEGMALAFCLSNPHNKDHGVSIFFGLSPEAVSAAGHKLTHYGKYSYVLFDNGTSVDKGVFPEEKNPLSAVF